MMPFQCEFVSCIDCARNMISTNILHCDSEELRNPQHFRSCEACEHSPHAWGDPMKIESLEGISRRLRNALVKGGVDDVAKLLLATSTQLNDIPNLGKTSFSELVRYLTQIKNQNSWSCLGLEDDGFSEVLVTAKNKALIEQQEVEIGIDLYFNTLCECNLPASEGRIKEINEDDRMVCALSVIGIIDNYLDTITDREERNIKIFRHRIGLDDAENNTLQAIGEEYCLTRERIRQIYLKVFRKVTRNRPEYIECRKKLFMQIKQYTPVEFYYLVFDDIKELTNRYFIIYLFNLLFRRFDITQFENKWKEYCDEGIHKRLTAKENLYLEAKLQRVVIFPGEMRKYRASVCTALPKRDVQSHLKSESGEVTLRKSTKPLSYESRLERDTLTFLDRNPWVKEINAQCVEIPYSFGGQMHKYYPDIVFKTIDDEICLLECKPAIRMAVYQNIVKYRALHQYCRMHGFGYTVIDSGFRSITDIITMEYNEDFAIMLEHACRNNVYLTWEEVLGIAKNLRIKVNAKELAAIVIKKRLWLDVKPFRLRMQPDLL